MCSQAKSGGATVLLLKSYDEPVTPYTGDITEDALTQFALSHAEPVLPEMDQCAPCHPGWLAQLVAGARASGTGSGLG